MARGPQMMAPSCQAPTWLRCSRPHRVAALDIGLDHRGVIGQAERCIAKDLQ
jgi:hypothetical protein